MNPSIIAGAAITGILCGCVATTPTKQSGDKATVELPPEKGLFPPPSMPRSIFEPMETAPIVTASFPWERTVPHVIVVPPPPPAITSEPAASPYPKAGIRPEYLIDTRHSLPPELDRVDQ